MKKASSIFFLFAFFLFQYGKMLDYMECRIVAAIESKSDCGCNTRLSSNASNDNSAQPFHEHHLKTYTEEFFDLYSNLIEKEVYITSKTVAPATVNNELPGFVTGILQPPRI